MAPNARGPPTATLVLAILLLAGFSVPSAQSQFPFPAFTAPGEGLTATIAMPYSDPLNMTFGTPGTILAGHHEHREAVPLWYEVDETYGNFGQQYDLYTGQALAAATAYEQSSPFLPFVPLDYHTEGGSTYTGWAFFAGAALTLLPESLLWGRAHVFPGDAWEVPSLPFFGHPVTTTITVEGDWFGPIVINVTHRITLGEGEHLSAWRLVQTDEGGPFASERDLFLGFADSGGETWHDHYSLPVTVTDPGGDPLPFQGHSEATIVAARDQTLDYGSSDFLPFDPEPHAIYDVHEAALLAWDLDHEALRVFKSRANDPYLGSARMAYEGQPGRVAWDLEFHEQGNNAVRVTLTAIKVPGQQLIVVSSDAASAHLHVAPASAEARAAIESAAIGQLARLVEAAMAPDVGTTRHLSWDLRGAAADTSFGLLTVDSVFLPAGSEMRGVWSDASTGIVTQTNGYHVGIQAPGLLPAP